MNRILGIATVGFVLTSCSLIKKQGKSTVAVEESEMNIVELSNKVDSLSFAIGVLLGENVNQEVDALRGSDSLNLDLLKETVISSVENNQHTMSNEEAQIIIQSYFQSKMKKENDEIINQGEVYMNNFSKEEGVFKTESGLLYKYINKGNGKSPQGNDRISCKYIGKFIDGRIFDASLEDPIEFGLNQVIKGWTEMLSLMKEGDKVEVVIPYTLAYGENGAGGTIPPYCTLVFEIELLKVL